MGNLINKKVQGFIVNNIKSYIQEKCNIEVPSVKVNEIISDSADSENLTVIAGKLWHMLRENGVPEEIAGILMDKFPELTQTCQMIVRLIDTEFSILQESVIAIQEQMHTDKIQDLEDIFTRIKKYKEESNTTQDEWIGTKTDLQNYLKQLAGEIKNNIAICNKAPREINNVNGILSALKFFFSRDINSKRIETALKMIGEALTYYEKGTEELFNIEMYVLNRTKNAKTTLDEAHEFISDNFLKGFDENNSNIMEWLTGEKIWTENPKAFCGSLNKITPKLDELEEII